MQALKFKPAVLLLMVCVALSAGACGGDDSSRARVPRVALVLPAAMPLERNTRAAETAIRFLENKVKSDTEDFSAHNKLAGFYLQHLRETGDVAYLDLALRAARASLASVPELRNTSGLAALTQVEFASHDFANARDHALRLIELHPGKTYPYGMLGDALLELGDYEEAAAAFNRMERVGGISDGTETRFARLAFLRGDTASAIELYESVVNRLPDPTFVAALGDLYKLAGREKERNAQYALVEQTARLSKANGVLYNRQLALFYADHDLKAEEAYASAVDEYQNRHDIYGVDALAGTALKAGKLAEAQAAMREALRNRSKRSSGCSSRSSGGEGRAHRRHGRRWLICIWDFTLCA